MNILLINELLFLKIQVMIAEENNEKCITTFTVMTVCNRG